METQWYKQMTKALQLNGKAERTQEAYVRPVEDESGCLLLYVH